MSRVKLFSAVLIGSLVLSSCSIMRTYRGDTQQGSIISQNTVKQLKIGMSKTEVLRRLGPPIVSQPFATDELVYVDRFQPGYGDATQKTLRLYFNRNGKLQRYSWH